MVAEIAGRVDETEGDKGRKRKRAGLFAGSSRVGWAVLPDTGAGAARRGRFYGMRPGRVLVGLGWVKSMPPPAWRCRTAVGTKRVDAVLARNQGRGLYGFTPQLKRSKFSRISLQRFLTCRFDR